LKKKKIKKTRMSEIYTLDSLHIENLPSPITLKQELPALAHHLEFIQESRNQIINILASNDQRLLLIVGPCSIHDVKAAKEYAKNLYVLAKTVSKSFFIIMRTYFEKPRTALGWKGILYDPHLDSTNDIAAGLRISRQLLLDLAEMEIPTATEFLDPFSPRYLSDLVSWSCIGARTSESQIHRQFASGLPMPVAFKNGTSGSINSAIKGILTASCPHAFFGINDHGHASIVRTKGNPHAHIALRGGENSPNYDAKSIGKLLEALRKNHLPERLIVDCSHGNSNRCPNKQKEVFESVIQQYLNGNSAIRGLAVESNLFAGNQRIPLDKSRLQYAVSITDPCLNWEETEFMVQQNAMHIENKQLVAEQVTGDV
jgi:3-deoxy-7-phosphoheptulonate synthase